MRKSCYNDEDFFRSLFRTIYACIVEGQTWYSGYFDALPLRVLLNNSSVLISNPFDSSTPAKLALSVVNLSKNLDHM